MKTFQGAQDDTLLRINKDNIDIDAKGKHTTFPLPENQDRISIALAVLGDPPPLSEAYASPQQVAQDTTLTDGELRFNAINALMALEIRRESLRQQTAEAKLRAQQDEKEEQEKQEQVARLESAYIKTLTKRRWSTAASRAIALTLYNQGARVLVPGETETETETDTPTPTPGHATDIAAPEEKAD